MKVIMPVYNVDEQFINLTDLAIQSLGKCELYIIDNASTVGGGQLRECADVYVRNKENLGYAKAVNQGLKLCSEAKMSNLVAVANNDIRVSSNWIEVAEEIMKDETIGSLHFTMLPYDQPFNLGDKVWLTGKERWCTGSFFVMRTLWMFDENFLNSYDDWDMHYRMYRDGYKTAYTNKVQYQHMNSFTQAIMPNRNEQDKKNKDYFVWKHGAEPEKIWEQMFLSQMNQDYRKGME
jgi:GT2 family glycosyltransferase